MFDQKEIDEAVGRLRRHYAAIRSSETYRDSPYHLASSSGEWDKDSLADDESMLASAYLGIIDTIPQ